LWFSKEVLIADERRPTVNELANQKGVVQRASGWKLQLFAAEFDALVCIFIHYLYYYD